MSTSEAPNLYHYSQEDMNIEYLRFGVQESLKQFYKWRDTHPDQIAEYIQFCTQQLSRMEKEQTTVSRIQRIAIPGEKNKYQLMQARRQLTTFSLRNMAEIPDPAKIASIAQELLQKKGETKNLTTVFDNTSPVLERAVSYIDTPTQNLIRERLQRLYRILPEAVIKNGAMGKVARTMLGISVIAAFDLHGESKETQSAHISHALIGALVLGAGYAIIDDTIHDVSAPFISPKDMDSMHRHILEKLQDGQPIDRNILPDHPITDELQTLYTLFTRQYPIQQYPQLYQAAYALYVAQHDDSKLTHSQPDLSVERIYPDVLIKASMTRIMANLIGKRSIAEDFYTRAIHLLSIEQLRDDAVDFLDDLEQGRVTPFTIEPKEGQTNPLYDIFAYDAYMTASLFPDTQDTLAYSQAIFFSQYLSRKPHIAQALIKRFGRQTPNYLQRFILQASEASNRVVEQSTPTDHAVRERANHRFTNRDPNIVDPRTFIFDKQIDAQIISFLQTIQDKNIFTNVRDYIVESGGKRMRPALTLMLAESLHIDQSKIIPLLCASELFHCASLLLDDLPWHDDSSTRRGKPTAHLVYEPATVELASIHTILEGLNMLQNIHSEYKPEQTVKLTQYVLSMIQRACVGQYMDLQKNGKDKDVETILRMYELKTSVPIETSLVSLMILEQRPEEEIQAVKKYAYHAGLVFQLQDDLLDILGKPEILGKDINQDTEKPTIPHLIGVEQTQQLIDHHLQEALSACDLLPFNTELLKNTVKYFRERRK
jgi:geranylgeranyl pyrophosphate synthase